MIASVSQRWNPAVSARLDDFLARVGRGEIEHPTAVFDFDGTLCQDDIGERFLKWQIAEHKLRDVDYGRDIYQDYEHEVKRDTASGYAMAVKLMKGLEERDVRAWAADFAKDHVSRFAFPCQAALVDRMLRAGVDVWIVSASSQHLVEAAAPLFGVAPDHAVGIRAGVQDGRLSGETVGPITYRQGKVEAIDERVGRRPDFASGNSMADSEMLASAGQLALAINPSQPLQERALAEGWAIQEWP